MSKKYENNKNKGVKKPKPNNILVNKKKFGPDGYFGNLTKKFFFQYSLVPEENILCDIKINNSFKCFFNTLKTYQKEISSKFLDDIKEKIQNDYQTESEGNVYLLIYLDLKDDYIKYGSKEIIDNLKFIIPSKNLENIPNKQNNTINEEETIKKIEKNEKDLIDINEFCILNNIKLILSTNFEECVQCIYQLTTLKINIKSLQNPKDNIINNDSVIDLLCKIEGINKNDAIILLSYYKSIKNICIATENNKLCSELNLLPLEHFSELDDKKKRAIYDVFHFPFKQI